MRALQAAALLLAACALAALPPAAAARRLLAAAANPVAPLPVRVGMASSDTPPLSEWVDGQPTGFEALLLDALAREAGLEPQVRARAQRPRSRVSSGGQEAGHGPAAPTTTARPPDGPTLGRW